MTYKILVVDDEDRARRLMEAMLVSAGYSVVLAENGSEAVNKAMITSPDVILLDVMMPVMNGFETAVKLQANKQSKNIPIVMVTALGEVKDRVRALESGADDFLTKPVDKTELLTRIKTLVEKSEMAKKLILPKKRPVVPLVSIIISIIAAVSASILIFTHEPVTASVIIEKEVIREVEVIKEVEVVKEVVKTEIEYRDVIREVVEEVIIEKPTELREFSSEEELKKWVWDDPTDTNVYIWDAPDSTERSSDNYDCDDFALDLQRKASEDGFLMSVTIIDKDDQPHMLNLVTIGNEIYYIEPQTDEVWFYCYIDIPQT